MQSLPFVTENSFWNVEQSGNYEKDFGTGKSYFAAFLNAVRDGAIKVDIIADILKGMPACRLSSGIEAGFRYMHARIISLSLAQDVREGKTDRLSAYHIACEERQKVIDSYRIPAHLI